MRVTESYLIDTNILLHLANPESPEHETVKKCLELLWERGDDLSYTSQNLAESLDILLSSEHRA
jgi:predicted nucleic acid-binding protein